MKLRGSPPSLLDTRQPRYCSITVEGLLVKTRYHERFSAQAKSGLMCCDLRFTAFSSSSPVRYFCTITNSHSTMLGECQNWWFRVSIECTDPHHEQRHHGVTSPHPALGQSLFRRIGELLRAFLSVTSRPFCHMMVCDHDSSCLSELINGEGYIGITRHGNKTGQRGALHLCQLKISDNRMEILNEIKAEFGGSTWRSNSGNVSNEVSRL